MALNRNPVGGILLYVFCIRVGTAYRTRRILGIRFKLPIRMLRPACPARLLASFPEIDIKVCILRILAHDAVLKMQLQIRFYRGLRLTYRFLEAP